MHRFGACCLAAVRAAVEQDGYTAVGVGDWLALGEGALDATHAVWHHDASARGFSPGMAGYIQSQVRKHKPGANIWVGLDGGWRFLAAGITYHAGDVLPGKPGNRRSVGVETDHTTGEDVGLDLLQSLRVGTAALFEHWERDASALEFHATVCSPVGRKTDPDGLDLATERAAVAREQIRLIDGTRTAPTNEDEELLMAIAKDDDDARRCLIRQWCWTHWGIGPSPNEQAYLLARFRSQGADLTLAEITDHDNAEKHRAKRAG